MVVKLIFTDDSSVIKNYTNQELFELGLFNKDQLITFFEKKFGFEDGEIGDFDFVDSPEGSDTYQFDIRNYFKYVDDFVGMEIGGKEVKSYLFPSEDSYEYNVNLMGFDKIKDLYTKYVCFELEDKQYDYYDDGGDPYNDDGPMDFEY
jgi:hypothetical protein